MTQQIDGKLRGARDDKKKKQKAKSNRKRRKV